MKLNELEKNKKVISLVGTISHLDEPKETPTGAKLQEGVFEDETGQVKITLWGEEANKYKVGEKVLMETGWCKEFEGALQISTGKFGKMKAIPNEKAE